MAHKFAQELDISPWEALLKVVRITAGKVAYCEEVLSRATSDEELEGRIPVEGLPTGVDEDGNVYTGKNLGWWVWRSEQERKLLARVSKMAVDAGVAQLLISQEVQQGQEMAAVLVRTLTALEEAGLSAEMLDVARNTMRSEILALGGVGTGPGSGAGGVKVIEGGVKE